MINNSKTLGIDTSNYTTSVALLESKNIINSKKLLPVKEGNLGLRQSDAVFAHIKQIDEVFEGVFSKQAPENMHIEAIGVSVKPRSIEGSYMPCFLVGEKIANIIGGLLRVPVYAFSHQEGHIMAALYSINELNLIKDDFIAFHVSGGTTEIILCEPDEENIIKTRIIGETLDLNAGQVVDRAGVMLGLAFPCGAELEKFAEKSSRDFEYKVPIKDMNVSFSGIENKFIKMKNDGESREDIAKFTMTAIRDSLDKMCEQVTKKYGNIPIVFSGGVSSNKMLKSYLKDKYDARFASPEFSADNAAGIAVLANLKHQMI